MTETLVLPGFVDPHVHLREPGNNHAETIANGTWAAMLGGYILVCDMPNTPGRPTWTNERLQEKRLIAQLDAAIPTHFHAGAQPESDNLDELAAMAEHAAGLKLYQAKTTGNARDYDAADFASVVQEWHRVAPHKPILLHAGKDMQPMIDLVADKHRHPLHICHVNNPHDVEIKKQARSKGLDVTCGVCPHHLFKTSHDVKSQGGLPVCNPRWQPRATAKRYGASWPRAT